MREIPLTKGKVAIVDDEDYVRLAKYKWHLFSRGYAARGIWENGKVKAIYMHREILNVESGFVTDHINGDKLDNRRQNLRICSQLENTRNRKKRGDCKLQFKGISKNNGSQNFSSNIKIKGERISLGSFKTQLEAAKAYDQAAIKYYGEFARLNFPETKEVLQRSNQNTLF